MDNSNWTLVSLSHGQTQNSRAVSVCLRLCGQLNTELLESDKLRLNLKNYVSENLDSMISFEFQTQRAMSLKLIYGQLKTYLDSGKLEPWPS